MAHTDATRFSTANDNIYMHTPILTSAMVCPQSSALKLKLKEDILMIIQSWQFRLSIHNLSRNVDHSHQGWGN